MKTSLLIKIVFLTFLHINLHGQSFELKNYSMTVAGTSSLHDWESSVERVGCNGAYTLNGAALSGVENVVFSVKVTDIKSTKGKMMDNKTYEAFNHEKNPFITFKLKSENIDAAKSMINLKGDLTMAGVTKPIDLILTYKILTGGEMRVTGSQKINMTDFGMEPPTAMMGTIKVGNEVTVKFDMTLTNNNKI